MIKLADGDITWVRAASIEGGAEWSPQVAQLHLGLQASVDRWVATPLVIDSSGGTGWWHSAPRQLRNVAAAHRFRPDESRAAWLRESVLAICDRSVDEWLGPFFRRRVDPPVGTLESAGVAMAVAQAVSLAPDAFSAIEQERACEIVRERGLTLGKRFLDGTAGMPDVTGSVSAGTAADPARPINNWAMMILNSYGTVAAVLDETSAIAETVERYGYLASLFETDSYGESLAYWAMAATQMSNLYEVLVDHDRRLADDLDLDCYTRCIPWAVQSHLGVPGTDGTDDRGGAPALPQALNFGDSDATFRPDPGLLAHCANRAQGSHPVEAGLARWLFDATCVEATPARDDSFALRTGVPWTALIHLRAAREPLSPSAAQLERVADFAAGTAILRDTWTSTSTVLGIQGTPGPLKVDSHRHDDLNSFILVHRGERLLADPGRCSYRLQTHQLSTLTTAHSTWTFNHGDTFLDQTGTARSAGRIRSGVTKDGTGWAVSDIGWSYPDPITRAERTWMLVGSHLVVMVDRITAAEPVTIRTHLVLNNRDNRLQVEDQGLVNPSPPGPELRLARDGVAARIIQVGSESDRGPSPVQTERRWGFMHDLYNPLPNQPGQGREGSAVIYDLVTAQPIRRHRACYVILLDRAADIAEWSVTSDAQGVITVTGKDTATTLELDDLDQRINSVSVGAQPLGR